MTGGLFVVLLLAVLVLVIIAKTAVVVPQQSAYVVERLGKYAATLDAGFHILRPLHRPHSLQTFTQGNGHRYSRAGLHHAR